MFIRPCLDKASKVEGARLLVRDPVTLKHLAAGGEHKPGSDYWLRRLKFGDVEHASAPQPAAKDAAA